MRLFFRALALFTLATTLGCSIDAREGEASGSGEQSDELRAGLAARYSGVVEVDGARYLVRLDVASTLPSRIAQKVDCWAHASNEPLCYRWFDGASNTIKTTLRVFAESGAMLGSTETNHTHAPGTGYLDAQESHAYLLNAAAPASETRDGTLTTDGVSVALPPGGHLQLARGYGIPGRVEVPATVLLSQARGSMVDNSSGVTRLSTHTFVGRPSLWLPSEVRFVGSHVSASASPSLDVVLHRTQ
ncbi:MAG: hypothetical protein IPG50_12305 [Myxococcales bacterium]|nr:hypothetical protein [Myxococcales bacterium]